MAIGVGGLFAAIDLWQVALLNPGSLSLFTAATLVGLYVGGTFLLAAVLFVGVRLRRGRALAPAASVAPAALVAAWAFFLSQGIVLRTLSSRSPWRTWLVAGVAAAAVLSVAPLARVLRRVRPARWRTGLAAALLAVGVLGAVRGFRAPSGPVSVPSAGEVAPGGAVRPNVILITIDTLRADHLSAYGYKRRTSPVIDGLAAEGVLFVNAFSQSTWTKPSTASLLTSHYPTMHQTNLEKARLPEAELLLFEVLRAQGYRTAVLSGNPWITVEYGFDQGVDYFYSIYDERFARVTLFMPALKRPNNLVDAPVYNLIKRFVQGELSTTERDDRLQAEAARWLATNPPRPFFIYLHMMSPHHPYNPPPPFDRAFVDNPQTPPVTSYPRKSYFFGEHGDPLPPAQLADMVGRYDGDILFADTMVGKLVATLGRLALLDDTVLIVTSDHGEEFYDHENWGHGHSVYNELLHVPLVIRYPALFAGGARVSVPVSAVDVMPTILELSGAPIPSSAAGRSLVALMRGTDPAPAGETYSELLYRYGSGRALIRGSQKFVGITVGTEERRELYDLVADPGETRNLAGAAPDTPRFATRLAEVRTWAEEHRVDAAEAHVTTDMEQRVRALGYVN
jgi:arylsulfatase A-like enzyme